MLTSYLLLKPGLVYVGSQAHLDPRTPALKLCQALIKSMYKFREFTDASQGHNSYNN